MVMTIRQFFILFRLRLLGVMVITLLAASAYLGLAKGARCATTGQMVLKGNFPSVDGVKHGTKIFLAGLPIGQVCDMKLITKGVGVGQVQLTLALANNLSLAEDSGFSIVSYGLAQPKVITVIPGGSPSNLANGNDITYTTGSVAIEKLLLLVLQRAESKIGINKNQ